ncbi:hypothetical protein [Mobilicoccus caccae]|uniref:Uncharacterized protein n=1 Tax=Mobilicoccus caccae TaxID=1859295 RepID=A0ABQ6IYK2_9MICO|nr:hypothetical protein [Mobilicoccus caccae]GMA42418.1 hypothetical protein GCM10025883_44630 [Mobilicoccus caccae]
MTKNPAPAIKCQWFALCPNPPAGTIAHPILGEVPACQRCADRMGKRLDTAQNRA